jgi:hypothetical protein
VTVARRVEIDAYEAALLHPELNLAPRIQAGWEALADLLSDGEWHDRGECYSAIQSSGEEGLAEGTATMIIRAATRYGLIEPRRGRDIRGGEDGLPLRWVSLYVAFRRSDPVNPPLSPVNPRVNPGSEPVNPGSQVRG